MPPYLRYLSVLWLVIGFALSPYYEAYGQSIWRYKTVANPGKADFELDSLTLNPGTLRCLSDTSLRFQFLFKQNKLRLIAGHSEADSLRFQYQTLPFAAYKPIFIFPRTLYDSILLFADYPVFNYRPVEKREELFALPGIQKTGSISRGISVGSNQNGFLNSAMNLQMEGLVAPGVKLTAQISDQSVPFQPQGNTQQIRELDRILIQLEHNRGKLQAGDIVLQNLNSSFLRYYKNIQGASVVAEWDTNAGISQTRLGGGIAKGKFASIVIEVKEGVQGPYRLRPPGVADLSVVILANSERVYFDNVLLKRGFNRDYVIDYNTGELTLNNQLLVTRFTRLRCDFEFAERNYSRTAWFADHTERIHPALTLQFSHYQEQDNPSRPLGFNLDSTTLDILQKAGADPSLAVLPSGTAVSQFQDGLVLYSLRDTVENGLLRTFFRLARPADNRLFQVSFSEVGAGRGDYAPAAFFGNGKSFVFVGTNKGSFAPVKQVALANKRAMSTAKLQATLGAGHGLEAEAGISQYDRNRFSTLDNALNQGNSQAIGYLYKSEKSSAFLPQAQVRYTRLSRNFSAIDRFRPIEFERDWNGSSGDTLAADDHLVESGLTLRYGPRWQLHMQSNYRNKPGNVIGWLHAADMQGRMRFWNWQNQGFLMENRRSAENRSWRRVQSDLSFDRYRLVPGYKFQLDENTISTRQADSVFASAMHFRSHSVYLKSKDSSDRVFQLAYSYREDQSPKEGKMTPFLFSHNIQSRVGFDLSETQRMEIMANYRRMQIAFGNPQRSEEHLSGRLDYSGSYLDGSVRQELTFTANTGQELRRDFQFIKINAIGEGTHQWIDYNGNGQQELEEFVEALRPEDRLYIKVFIPTNQFIPAYTSLLNYRLNLNAPSDWQIESGWKKGLSSLSAIVSIVADQKNTSSKLAERYSPLFDLNSEALLSTTRSFRNTIFWNRTRSSHGAEYSYFQSVQRLLISGGFSQSRIAEHQILFRKNLSEVVSASQAFQYFQRSNTSDALRTQNYQLEGWSVAPELALQPSFSYRISLNGSYSERKNRSDVELANIAGLGLDFRLNQQSKRSMQAGMRYSHIRYTGQVATPAAYELLEGLNPGGNLTWNLILQQKLAQGLQITFSYEGRSSENLPIVHLGKVQASVLF